MEAVEDHRDTHPFGCIKLIFQHCSGVTGVENSSYIFNSVEWDNKGYGEYILTTSYIPTVRENMKQGHRGENIRTFTLFASSSDKGYEAIDTRTPTISVQEANETTGKVPAVF